KSRRVFWLGFALGVFFTARELEREAPPPAPVVRTAALAQPETATSRPALREPEPIMKTVTAPVRPATSKPQGIVGQAGTQAIGVYDELEDAVSGAGDGRVDPKLAVAILAS